jgi:hypothetical protein
MLAEQLDVAPAEAGLLPQLAAGRIRGLLPFI